MYRLFILLIFITGCATYDANKDPVYQSYLAGKISYADYVEHYDALMGQRQARAVAFQQGMQRSADAMAPKKSYSVRPDYTGGYTVQEN